MKIKLIAVGKLKGPLWRDAYLYYRRMLGRYCLLKEVIVKDEGKGGSPRERIEKEGKKILARIGNGDLVIPLDERGVLLSSEEFAKKMTQWVECRSLSPCFVIGGSHGLSPAVKERAHFILSLGKMTFPHEMVRVILLEQLYRAQCILHHHPYHH